MIFLYFFSIFVWDPPRDLFVIPIINHPLTWYGLLFAVGFFLAFFVVRNLLTYQLHGQKQIATELTDQLIVFAILGTIIGARLGHVFFYEWPYYSAHPIAILKIWEGGLASHGGAVGVLCALIFFTLLHRKRFSEITFLATLDIVTISASLIGGFIRVGNFINQEILGTPTHLPWGVIFLHPAQNVDSVPLHPVQLYEAIVYFAIFAILLFIWKKMGKRAGSGVISGLFFLLVFGSRFLFEFIKLPQSEYDSTSVLNMGQLLSLPFILIGIVLLVGAFVNKKRVRL